jgi:hypothetical protein
MKNLRLMEDEPDCRVHLLVFPSMRLFLKLPESWRQILSRSLELDVLAALFVFAAASFTFLKLVSEMREGETHSADQAILLALRDPNDLSNPIGPQWVEAICRDLTSLGSPTVLALFTFAAVSYLWIDGKRAVALFVALSITGGAVLVSLLKFSFARAGFTFDQCKLVQFPQRPRNNGRSYVSYAWRPPGASAEAATHEALPADSRVDPRAPRRIHARVSRRPLANGRSRWMVHWNGLGAGMLAYCDLATKWRYH